MRTSRIAAFAVLAVVAMLLFPALGRADSSCTIALTPNPPSPQLVGQRVVWTATATNCGDAPVYQFKVAVTGDSDSRSKNLPEFTMVRDFSLANTIAWGPLQEGSYQIMVSVKDNFDAVDSTSATVPDTINSLVTGKQAVVTPTLNPLVALYSAPACKEGTMNVKFRLASSTKNLPWMTTNTLPCVRGQSRNFVVAGMLANTRYEMVHVAGNRSPSPSLFFTTGTLPDTLSFPSFTVRTGPLKGSDLSQNMIYHNFTARPGANTVNLVATDLKGLVEWYCDPLASGLFNGAPGVLDSDGTVFFLGRDNYRKLGLNVLRQIDLTGTPLQETNIDAVNAQLTAQGQGVIYGFHHDVLRFSNGNIATLGWNLRTIDVNGVPTPYAGVLLMVLDKNFQVIWTWDAFDHLDVNRGPILGDVCTGQPCPIPGAVDWMHANSVARSPEDGNLVISLRNQAWAIKIDYQHGSGDGHVIWRLGKDGDFAVDSNDSSPWFSYQHNVHYLDKGTLLLFDNGNVRCAGDQTCNSRGQSWTIDEKTMKASLIINVDLGNYSTALGSAERLPNGNFVFTSGALGTQSAFGQSIEVLPDGTKEYVLEGGGWEYRTYRMRGLYRGIRR